MHMFKDITPAPADPIFGLQQEFKEDRDPKKVNLTVGVYVEEDGAPHRVFDCVKQAEEQIIPLEPSKTYLPLDGDSEFVEETGKLLFGNNYSDRIYGAQTVGGTSAIYQVMCFMKEHVGHRMVLSKPTWANHIQIAQRVGFEIEYYPYFMEKALQYERMMEQLKTEPSGSIVLFQPSNHNPTGADLTLDQWKEISQLCKEKHLIPLFDIAYQGFGQGMEEDVMPVALFHDDGHEFFVTYSFSKLLGLYRERVGAAFYVMQDPATRACIQSNVKKIIRTDYSNPPAHGAFIAKQIMKDPSLKESWMQDVARMRTRMQDNRKILAHALNEHSASDQYEYIATGNGFFCQLGLSKEEVQRMKEEFHIYMTGTSRINVTGINPQNLDYLIKALTSL